MGLLIIKEERGLRQKKKSCLHDKLCETLSLGPGINNKDKGVVVKRVLEKNKATKRVLGVWEMGALCRFI